MVAMGLQFSPAQASSAFGPQVGFYRSSGAAEYRAMGGLALRFKISEHVGLQASINYRVERYMNDNIRAASWPVLVSGLFYPTPHIFGTIGTGWYNTSVDYSIPTTNPPGTILVSSEQLQEFGWHFGGGLELPLGLGTKLVGDVKYVFLDYEFKNFPGSGGVNSNFYVVSIGLLFGV